MKVKIVARISGTRNGSKWPAPGETLEVTDGEGADLCRNGLAEPVAQTPRVEKAAVETRTAKKASKKASK